LAWEAVPRGILVGDEEPGKTEGQKEEGRGRFVDVGVFPMGIDVSSIKEKKFGPL
jgi:trehalose 6-phosphate synthase/phosphatase